MNDLDQLLDGIRSRDDVIGCAIVTRDGLPGPMRFNQPHDPQTLSAMAAATLAAAETALAGIDPADISCVVIQGSATRTVIQGLDAKHLFVIIANERVPVDELVQHATSAQQGITAHAS